MEAPSPQQQGVLPLAATPASCEPGCPFCLCLGLPPWRVKPGAAFFLNLGSHLVPQSRVRTTVRAEGQAGQLVPYCPGPVAPLCLLQVLKKAFQATFQWLQRSPEPLGGGDLEPHAQLFLKGSPGPAWGDRRGCGGDGGRVSLR